MNSIRKYGLSSSLERADWNNSTIIRGDVAAEVAKLKQHDGQDVVMYGHGPLGQTLLEHHLLDELGCGSTPSSWAAASCWSGRAKDTPETHSDKDARDRRRRPLLPTGGDLMDAARQRARAGTGTRCRPGSARRAEPPAAFGPGPPPPARTLSPTPAPTTQPGAFGSLEQATM